MGNYGALAASLVTLLMAGLCLLVQARLKEKRPHLSYWAAAHVALAINFALFGYGNWTDDVVVMVLTVLIQQSFAILLAFGIRHHFNLPANLTAALALTVSITALVCTLMLLFPPVFYAAPGVALILGQIYGGTLLLVHRRSVLYLGLGSLLLIRSLNTMAYVAVAQQSGGPPTAEWPFIITLLLNLATGIGLLLLEFDDAHRAMAASAREKEDTLTLLQAVIDTVQAVVHYKDHELRYQLINRRGRAVLGYGDSDVVGKRLSEVAPPDLALPIERGDRAVLHNKDSTIDQEWTWRDADTGQHKVYWLNKSVVRNASGEPTGIVTAALDITALKETEQRLIHEREMAERANRAKSQFLANMSHELRTPLNAILGFSEMLEAGYLGELSPRQQEYLNHIHRSGQHLLTLVNDILDLSKIDAGKMRFMPERLDVDSLVAEAVAMVAPAAQNDNVTITNLPCGFALYADRRSLTQVLLNLLSNAVKFNRSGGSVTLRGDQRDGRVAITVADTGFGMNESEIARAFEPFQRGDAHKARFKGGTGLGLAISRNLVELQGGRFLLESHPGTGTTVRIEFPALPAGGSLASVLGED